MDLIIFFSSQCKSSFPSHNIKSSWVLKHKIVPHKKCIGFLWWFIEHKKHTNIWYQVSTLLLQEGERRHFTLFIVPWKKFFLSYKVWNQLWNKKRYSILLGVHSNLAKRNFIEEVWISLTKTIASLISRHFSQSRINLMGSGI